MPAPTVAPEGRSVDARSETRSTPLPLAAVRCAGADGLLLHALACTGDDPRAQRLALLGLRPGCTLQLLQRPGRRGAVVGVSGTRIALGPEWLGLLQVLPR